MAFFLLTLLSALILLSHSATEENTTLLLVQTFFRHGDRAPIYLYPTDPNIAEYWPNGLGELTQRGKQQLYAVGKFLRYLYKDFITSDPNEVFVNSASERRCINSVEAYMAAFYAPDEKWQFVSGLNWQPIPVHYMRSKIDFLLNHRTTCARNTQEYLKSLDSKVIQEFYQKHQALTEAVSNYSGLDYSKPKNAYALFNILNAEKTHNRTIPEWAQNYWSEMKILSDLVFKAPFSTPVQRRLLVGPFLGSVNHNLLNKINGKTPALKFVINSSHGVNLAALLRALNFTTIPRPPYGATLMFELHRMADASMAVRLRFLNSSNVLLNIEEPNVLVLENCSEFCPVEFFMKSYQWLIPNSWAEECQLDTYDVSGSQLHTSYMFEKYLLFTAHIFFVYFFFP